MNSHRTAPALYPNLIVEHARLSDEKLAALMREQGATGSFGE